MGDNVRYERRYGGGDTNRRWMELGGTGKQVQPQDRGKNARQADGRTVIRKRQRWETGIRGSSVDGKHTRAMGTPVVRSTIGAQWMDLRYCKYYRRVEIH